MGKLSKAKGLTEAEKYCIQGMYYNEMSLEEISKTLGREDSDVELYLNELNKEDNDRTFIINETGSGNKGVAVMTQAGSERVDAARERFHSQQPRSQATTIHSIHD
jgi:chromosome segregation and condensation protein ScpB